MLALIYALGTGLLVVLASAIGGSAGGLFAVFLVYWLVTAPAYSLCNSLAMRNLDDPGRDSAGCGRGGRPAGCWPAGSSRWSWRCRGRPGPGHGAFEALWVAAAFSAAASFYCLTLPHTPPLAVGPRGRGTVAGGPRARPPARRRGRAR